MISHSVKGSIAVGMPIQTPIAGMTCWLDASDRSSLSLFGTKVGTWADKSGNQRNFSHNTDANRPILIENGMNGKSTIRFILTDQLSLTSSVACNQFVADKAFTVFIVVGINSINTNIATELNGSILSNNGTIGFTLSHNVTSSVELWTWNTAVKKAKTLISSGSSLLVFSRN